MASFLTLKLDGKTVDFQSRRQLRDWWDAESQHWSWIWKDNPVHNDLRGLANIARQIDSELKNNTEPAALNSSLMSFFREAKPSVRYSGSFDGQRYINAYRYAGREAAIAVMLVEQQPNLRTNLTGRRSDLVADYARGVAASFSGVGADRAEMAQERRNYRTAIDKLGNRVRELEREKDAFIATRGALIRRWRRSFIRRFRKNLIEAQQAFFAQQESATKQFNARREEALKSIAETEDSYRTQMALKAPVQYWADKARRHSRWVVAWAAVMIAYFLLAAVGIYFIAQQAASYLLAVPTGANATPIYIIVSGATLGATTLVFWLGRLITKLFLSEHHLASNAREKSVMMQAFLSMETRESFSSEERAIVLASIFHSSPDGIVKDDGPADLGVQALLARQLVR